MIRHSMMSCYVLTEDGPSPALIDRDHIVFCVEEREGVNVVLKSGTELRLLDLSISALWHDYEPKIDDGMRG